MILSVHDITVRRQQKVPHDSGHREALGLPAEKQFQRFSPLDAAEFLHPEVRTERYTLIEFSMLTSRSEATKRRLIRLQFERLATIGIALQDIEITLGEMPAANWGRCGEGRMLDYDVGV